MAEDRKNAQGEWVPVHRRLDPRTLIFDHKTDQQVMWIDGILPLPVGATIHLTHSTVDAVVVAIRLLPGSDQTAVTLCLHVAVPSHYWQD